MNKTVVTSIVTLLLCGGAIFAAWLLAAGGPSPSAASRPSSPVARRVAATAASSAPARPAVAVAAPRLGRPQGLWRDYPTASPFQAVRWRGDVPEVAVAGRWYELVSLDSIPAAQVLSFCRALDERQWQKRFEQDLFEVLCRMSHEPGAAVKLVVREPGKDAPPQTLENVPMTAANRRAIWSARR